MPIHATQAYVDDAIAGVTGGTGVDRSADADLTIPAANGFIVPQDYEIALTFTVELEAGAVMEIL